MEITAANSISVAALFTLRIVYYKLRRVPASLYIFLRCLDLNVFLKSNEMLMDTHMNELFSEFIENSQTAVALRRGEYAQNLPTWNNSKFKSVQIEILKHLRIQRIIIIRIKSNWTVLNNLHTI